MCTHREELARTGPSLIRAISSSNKSAVLAILWLRNAQVQIAHTLVAYFDPTEPVITSGGVFIEFNNIEAQ